jgi:hypothetical protein
MPNKKTNLEQRIFLFICEHEEGVTPTQISEKFKLSKQNVNYYLKKLLENFTIKKGIKSIGTFYCKNSAGLEGGVKFLPKVFTVKKPEARFDNMHNIWFKLKIRKDADIWFPNETQMNNWVKQFGWYGFVKVAKNSKSSIEIRFRCDRQRDPYEATMSAYKILYGMIDLLERTYGLELGHPQMVKRPHYTIRGDPVAKKVKGAVYSENGHIDHSHDEGEVEYYDSKDVKSYIELPIAVRRLEEMNKVILKSITVLADSQVVDKTIILKEIIKTIKKEG